MNDRIFALVDCNNFYVSCEKLFAPHLEGKPVVVLSNNDGCVISRSDEAKKIGIGMGVPVFTIPEIIREHQVHVFSTNYTLYGDISGRVMEVLSDIAPEMEIYSIDEAFLDLSGTGEKDRSELANTIIRDVRKKVGIPVSVGIAPTKTLAKLANHLAKNDQDHPGTCILDKNNTDGHLEKIGIREIWGIGGQYAEILQSNRFRSALDLKLSDEFWIKKNMGIMVQRIVKELRGTLCYPLESNPEPKKEICTSRSFGKPLKTYEELEPATMSYVTQAARKLRKQNSYASTLMVFVMTNKYASGPKYVNYKIVTLPSPDNSAAGIMRLAATALKEIFREGYEYKKSGIVLSGLIPAGAVQTTLWNPYNREKEKMVGDVIDRINRKAGAGKLIFGIECAPQSWKMKQENLSPRFTTHWDEILKVNMDNDPSDTKG